SGHRLQVDQRLAQRLTGVTHGAFFARVAWLQEIVIVGTSAAALAAAFTTTVVFDDDADIETHQRTNIRRQAAVAGGDQDMFPKTGETYCDLLDTRIQRTGGDVDAFEQLDLGGPVPHIQRVVTDIQALQRHAGKGLHAALL